MFQVLWLGVMRTMDCALALCSLDASIGLRLGKSRRWPTGFCASRLSTPVGMTAIIVLFRTRHTEQ